MIKKFLRLVPKTPAPSAAEDQSEDNEGVRRKFFRHLALVSVLLIFFFCPTILTFVWLGSDGSGCDTRLVPYEDCKTRRSAVVSD